jgi:acetamidase/formamidase
VLAVYIESMAPRGDNPRGTCAMIPQFGALSGTSLTALLADSLPEIVRKIDVDEEGVYWSPRVTLPYRPHIGTLSCSPEIDSINTLTPDSHGGNMDLPDMGRQHHLPAGAHGRRAPLHRRCARLPGRWRGVRNRRRIPEHHDHPRRPDQGLGA